MLSIQLPAAPAADGFQRLGHIDPAGLRQHQSFGHGQAVADHDHLVDQFDRLAGAVRADVGDALAHGLQHGQSPLQRFGLAADHDAERALGRALAAAADGRVEHAYTLGRQCDGDITGCCRADGAHVDHQAAGPYAVDHALLAQDHFLNVRCVADTSDDDIAPSGQFGRIACDDRAGRGERLGAFSCAVPHRQCKAGLE